MYYHQELDSHGFIHSIDMVTIDYMLKIPYKLFTDKLVAALLPFGFSVDKQSKLDKLPSHRYEYYTNIVWFEGLIFSLGKWSNYDKENKTWYALDYMRFKVNPNKHAETPLFAVVMALLKEYCSDGCLVRYDYAIDVPVPISDVLVIGSRKEKGLYKGTRYFGQRHKHGYLKLYDKAKEMLDSQKVLTRIEYTYKGDMIPSWDKIVVRAPVGDCESISALPGTARLYLDMLVDIRALGGEIEPYLERMTHRMYKQLEPYLFKGIELQLNQTILEKLLKQINDMFIISDTNNKVNRNDEFMTVFDTDLPFD